MSLARLAPTAALALALAGAAVAQESRPTSQPDRPQLPPLGRPAGVFGAEVTVDERTRLADVAADPAELEGETIRVEGTIEDVCTKKGCWMVLRDGEEEVRVRFVDYSFFVPRDAHDRRAIVQGTAKAEAISEEMARHYAEESGSPEEAEAIDGPQQVISFTATAVEILGSDELPLAAEGDGAEAAALAERVAAAAAPTDDRAYEAAPVDDAAAALERVRAVPGARTLEFDLWTEVEGWVVFGAPGDERFASGAAVEKATGRVVRF